MGYNAVYPTETIEAHRALIARRRILRPAQGYRTPTPTEWEDFLRDNLVVRIAEAEREGRLGEVEGLRISLGGAEDMLRQMARTAASAVVDLPTPMLRSER
ncbi:hypothetical protein [Streptomyces sp. NPDC096339]|uniref:hypothetical protein n=1 Tax=Streptomyces sp. NPDC096339 TaxID=3366086 RepID=UPI00381F3300